mmetsp:Transcript_43744/g.136817  ORF Transcript_43744/g.136817 Transcript_43744/m.136817 type:complete len:380 (+) Transcript_43744:49-1188(+)
MMLRGRRALVVCLVGLAGLAEAYVQPTRFLIISSPTTHNVYYAQLPSLHDLTLPWQQRKPVEAKVLIDGSDSRCSGAWCYEDSNRGLRAPRGLALQQGCGSAILYVSDTDTQDLFAYELSQDALGNLQAGSQRLLRQGVAGEAEWLAVDNLGNLFMTSTGNNQVQKISAERLFSAENRSEKASVLYSADATPTVAAPAGVAADGFFVYWANQNGGGDAGTIARGPERAAAAGTRPPVAVAIGAGAYEAIASNVCIARDNAFFTGGTGSVFAAKKNGFGGGNMTEVASGLQRPLGCTYDGESTLYVADGGDDVIYSMPANMVRFRKVRHIAKVVKVPKPNQVAVFSGATSRLCPERPMSGGAFSGRLALTAAVVAAAAAA